MRYVPAIRLDRLCQTAHLGDGIIYGPFAESCDQRAHREDHVVWLKKIGAQNRTQGPLHGSGSDCRTGKFGGIRDAERSFGAYERHEPLRDCGPILFAVSASYYGGACHNCEAFIRFLKRREQSDTTHF
jgi:hypothetical protein